jgi:GT2 family glycosyltransferase
MATVRAEVGMLRASLHGFAGREGASDTVPSASAASERVEEPPPISPLPPLAERPFWSVMIPIYNCREDYLRETLGSVLRQDPGAADMQIEVLDNCSTIGDPEAVVREMGAGRIGFHRQTHNLGTGGNFNACIERARGHWVHILHGDDTVRPDFYSRARAAVTAHPEVAAALCRIIYMDEHSQWTGLTELECRTPGVLDGGFAWRQFLDQRIQFVAMVVRRSTYEELGGFRFSLPHCLDWDMWKRIALRSPLHYDPEPLACFRLHAGADSSRLIASGANVREERRSIAYSCAELPAEQAAMARRAASKAAGMRAARRARLLGKRGMRNAAWRQLAEAVRCSWAPAVVGRSVFVLLSTVVQTRDAGRETA